MDTASNITYASPVADAAFARVTMASEGLVNRLLSNLNGWTLALTIFLGLVAYDQSTSDAPDQLLQQS